MGGGGGEGGEVRLGVGEEAVGGKATGGGSAEGGGCAQKMTMRRA